MTTHLFPQECNLKYLCHMKYKTGENLLVSGRLVCRILSRFLIINNNFPNFREQTDSIAPAETDIRSILADVKVLPLS